MECTHDAAPEVGVHADPITAQAWADDGAAAEDSDPVHYVVGEEGQVTGPAIMLEAAIGGVPTGGAPGPELEFGAPVSYTYRISNVGTEELWALYVDQPGIPPTLAANSVPSIS